MKYQASKLLRKRRPVTGARVAATIPAHSQGRPDTDSVIEWISLMQEWDEAQADLYWVMEPSVETTPDKLVAMEQAQARLKTLKQQIDAAIKSGRKARNPQNAALIIGTIKVEKPSEAVRETSLQDVHDAVVESKA